MKDAGMKDAATRLQKCYDCGTTMKAQVENYRYVESGLKNVILKGILVFRCKKCGADVPEIVAASALHSLIGLRLLFKDTRLNGDEVRFLRKLVGYSASQLAELAGTSKSVVSRWENRTTLGSHTDRLIRMICFNKMLQDAFPKDDATAATAKTLMDASVLARSMETLLKNLRDKKDSKKSMEIERKDLEKVAAYSGPVISLQAAAQLQ
jgi:transcriptional regulator with XRE-family HTH domain